MNPTRLIGSALVAIGMATVAAACDDDREIYEERAEAPAAEPTPLGEQERRAEPELAAGEPAPSGGVAEPEPGQGLATAEEPGLGMGSAPIGQPEPRPGAVGAATSIPADGTVRQVAARVRRELRDRDLTVVHSQRLRAQPREADPSADPAEGKPGEAQAGDPRAELILFADTTALEEALSVNPARALGVPSQVLVYQSGDGVYIAYQTPERVFDPQERDARGMAAGKPGEQPAARSTTDFGAVDLEAIAEAAARRESQRSGMQQQDEPRSDTQQDEPRSGAQPHP